MLRLAPGYRGDVERFARGAEVFVVEGELSVDGVAHRAGTWLRLPPVATWRWQAAPGRCSIARRAPGRTGLTPHIGLRLHASPATVGIRATAQ